MLMEQNNVLYMHYDNSYGQTKSIRWSIELICIPTVVALYVSTLDDFTFLFM